MKKIIFVGLFFTITTFFSFLLRAQNTFPTTNYLLNYLEGEWDWSYSQLPFSTYKFTSFFIGANYSCKLARTTTADKIAWWFYKNDTLCSSSVSQIYKQNGAFTFTMDVPFHPHFPVSVDTLLSSYDSVFFKAQNCADFCYFPTYSRIKGAGLGKIDLLPFIIFPNPSYDYVSFNNTNPPFFSYTILSSDGRCMQAAFVPEDRQINIASLPPGVFFLELRSAKRCMRSPFIKL